MNAKIFNSLSIVCLLALIGVMSWRDMHPHIVKADNLLAMVMLTYYAGPEITPATMPDDSRPVTIDVGDFSYTPAGKMVWTPHGMPPTTFAQRQINLQFNFKDLPQNPAQTIEKIRTVSAEWVHKGDTVNIYVFNYSAAKADLKAYEDILRAAYNKFTKVDNRFMIIARINPQWDEGTLNSLQAFSPRFLVNLPQKHIAPELLSQLAALKYNLILQYPAGTRVEDVDMGALRKLGSLSGITLALDPGHPLLKKEEKVGLFPKF